MRTYALGVSRYPVCFSTPSDGRDTEFQKSQLILSQLSSNLSNQIGERALKQTTGVITPARPGVSGVAPAKTKGIYLGSRRGLNSLKSWKLTYFLKFRDNLTN